MKLVKKKPIYYVSLALVALSLLLPQRKITHEADIAALHGTGLNVMESILSDRFEKEGMEGIYPSAPFLWREEQASHITKTVKDSQAEMLMGHSRGGLITYLVACDAPETLEKVVVVNGYMHGECQPPSLSVHIIHNLNDKIIPPRGRPFFGIPSLTETVDFWTDAYGCKPHHVYEDDEILQTSYICERGHLALTLVKEGGHDWKPLHTEIIFGYEGF